MSIIEVSGLHKAYGDVVAVEDVSLSVEQGEIFGVLGRNGAGKTTTVETVAGLRTADRGSVRVDGLDPRSQHDQVAQILGVQLQESNLQDTITVAEALDLYASFYSNPIDWRPLIDDLGLTSKLDARYEKLSGGQKQRVSIALALVGNPKVAILDELTTGLDPQARRDTWGLIETVRERGVTIVLVTHFMEEAERLCDRIAIIHRGRVAALDTPTGLIDQVAEGQRIRFRTESPLDPSALLRVPSVTDVKVDGQRVVVSGGDAVLFQLVGALEALGVEPLEFAMDRPTMDDAFLEITGEAFEGDAAAAEPAAADVSA
jgi:ABC-2 type transport system ATP-binding protein